MKKPPYYVGTGNLNVYRSDDDGMSHLVAIDADPGHARYLVDILNSEAQFIARTERERIAALVLDEVM